MTVYNLYVVQSVRNWIDEAIVIAKDEEQAREISKDLFSVEIDTVNIIEGYTVLGVEPKVVHRTSL